MTLYGTQASAEGPVIGQKATCSRETRTPTSKPWVAPGLCCPRQNANMKAGRSPGPATPNMHALPARVPRHLSGHWRSRHFNRYCLRSRPPFTEMSAPAAGLAYRECCPDHDSTRSPLPLAAGGADSTRLHPPGCPPWHRSRPRGVPLPPCLVQLAAGRPPPRARGACRQGPHH